MFNSKAEACSHLNVQADIGDLERGLLAHIDAHKLGRVLVEDVDVSKTKQQQLLPHGGGEAREERGHGWVAMPWGRRWVGSGHAAGSLLPQRTRRHGCKAQACAARLTGRGLARTVTLLW